MIDQAGRSELHQACLVSLTLHRCPIFWHLSHVTCSYMHIKDTKKRPMEPNNEPPEEFS